MALFYIIFFFTESQGFTPEKRRYFYLKLQLYVLFIKKCFALVLAS